MNVFEMFWYDFSMKRKHIIEKLIKLWRDTYYKSSCEISYISLSLIPVSNDLKLCKSKHLSSKGYVVMPCHIIAFACDTVYLDVAAVSYDYYDVCCCKSLLLDECPLKLLEQIVQSLPFELKIQYDLNECI